MNGRLVRIVLLMSLAAAAACRGDAPAEEEQGSAGFVLPGEEAYVSPEDSAQAEESAQSHAQAVRDSLRRATGGDAEEEDAPAAPPAGASRAARYEACMRQAAQAEGAVRERLAQACENIRAQPDAPAP